MWETILVGTFFGVVGVWGGYWFGVRRGRVQGRIAASEGWLEREAIVLRRADEAATRRGELAHRLQAAALDLDNRDLESP